MEGKQTYRINRPIVVDEVLGDEVVIVNLDNGYYYSLSGCGVEIWQGVDRGLSSAAIVDALKAQFGEGQEALEKAVEELVARLQEEALIVDDGGKAPAREKPATGQEAGEQARTEFQTPKLEKYTDLDNLLLLDPIHEVDELGWPHAAPEE